MSKLKIVSEILNIFLIFASVISAIYTFVIGDTRTAYLLFVAATVFLLMEAVSILRDILKVLKEIKENF